MVFPFIVKFCAIFVIVLRKGQNKQKEAEFGPFFEKKRKDKGAEPWSSGNGRRLIFGRSWVRITTLFTGWT